MEVEALESTVMDQGQMVETDQLLTLIIIFTNPNKDLISPPQIWNTISRKIIVHLSPKLKKLLLPPRLSFTSTMVTIR
jgi:hypothetical protein